MSGFLIDGVPFVSEGDDKGEDIQGYLDSDYPGNVNEYTTTTTNTGVTTPVPGLEEHNYIALRPNLPTRYKLRDVSLNEYAFAFSGTYKAGTTPFDVSIPTRFNKVFYVISGGGGGKGGKGHDVNVKANSNNPGTHMEEGYNGGEGGIGASGEIITGSWSVDGSTRVIQIQSIGINGEDGISRNELLRISQKADHYTAHWHKLPDGSNLPGGSGEDGNATTIVVGAQQITAIGGSGGGGGGASNGEAIAYLGTKWNSLFTYKTNYHVDVNGLDGTPGTPGTPNNNPKYTQSNQGTVREWRPGVGNNGFVKIYFS